MMTKEEKTLRKKFKHLGKYMNLQLGLPNFKEQDGQIFKLCTKCKQYFPMSEDYFPTRKNVKCGYDSHCKECHQEKEKQRIRIPAFNNLGQLRCCTCGKYKQLIEFNKGGSIHKNRNGYSRECKECESLRKKNKRLRMNDSDPISFFKHLIYGCKTRSRSYGSVCTLTIEQLIDLYEKQNKKCALSGIEMTTVRKAGKNIYNASIDRIIPGGDYSIDNIRLVCNQVNMMRSNLSDCELLFLCKSIVNTQDNESDLNK